MINSVLIQCGSNFPLKQRSSLWNAIYEPPSMPEDSIPMVKQALVIMSNLDMSSLPPYPVNHQNAKEWTEAERIKAEDAIMARNIDHLQSLVKLVFHKSISIF